MGKNTLNTLISQMCQEAGIQGRKTNHSLRATGATALFNAQVPEKMIKEVTGHHSSKALALYERPSLAQKQALSNVIAEGGNLDKKVQAVQKHDSRSAVQSCSVSATQHRCSTKQGGPAVLISSLFSGLNNCTINFSPQNLNINVGAA